MEQIRSEALRQFALKGLAATRIQDIANGVGMAQGLLYHYYPSKESIYIDLVKDALDKTIEASLALKAMDTSAQEKINIALRELFHTIEVSERFAQTCCLIAQMADIVPQGEEKKSIEKKRKAPYQIVADIIRQGQSEGNLAEGDPDELSLLLWSTINGLAIFRVSHAYGGPMPDYRLLAAMFITKSE
jgi:TetR/AcrR family transcriptional regulator